MANSVQYLVAQYVPNPLRQEPRNVGIVAKYGQLAGCRFVGENRHGKMDGRKLRLFRFPDVYKQWVEYWKASLAREADIDSLTEDNAANYRLVRGGFVVDIGTDPIEDVVSYLFRELVAEDGDADAVRVSDAVAAIPSFRSELSNTFKRRGLLYSSIPERSLFAHYPIVQNRELSGTSTAIYRPQFSQENGTLFVMESFDFAGKPSDIEGSAGLAAYMYRDIRDAREDVTPISLVRGLSVTAGQRKIGNSICMLTAESRIVDWSDPADRDRFLGEREKIAGI